MAAEIYHENVAFVVCENQKLAAFMERTVNEADFLRVLFGVVQVED